MLIFALLCSAEGLIRNGEMYSFVELEILYLLMSKRVLLVSRK